MTRVFIIIVGLALASAPLRAQVDESTVESQQQAPVEEPELPKSPSEKSATSSTPAPKSKSQPETTVFNPTEEISADTPVPFPVDI